MVLLQEVADIKSAYNNLVFEYNLQSPKFNWKIFNTKYIKTTYRKK